MTLILQDDHLTSGAWATYGVRESMSSAPGSRLGLVIHCVVLLGKTRYTNSASLYPGV